MAYNSKYNGNVIYYDPYQTINATKALGRIKDFALEQSDLISQDDQYFNSVPERYACLIPNPRYSGQKPYIDGLVTDGYDVAISTLTTVTNAIIDYCNEDGVFTEESKAVLDSYLRKKSGGNKPGGGSDGASDSLDDEDDNLSALNNETSISDSDINKVGPDDNLSVDEEMIISEAVGAAVADSVISGIIGNSSLSPEAQDELLDDFSTSLYGSSINVPGPVVDKIDKLTKSGLTGPAALATFAVTGLGGMIFYNKKSSDEEDDDDDMDTGVLTLNKKSGTNLNSSFISGSTVVFKHDLLEKGEVNE